jgi:hypothetical protein
MSGHHEDDKAGDGIIGQTGSETSSVDAEAIEVDRIVKDGHDTSSRIEDSNAVTSTYVSSNSLSYSHWY